MKIIWCAGDSTARVSDESEGYVHFAYRETREREKRDFMTDLKFVSWKEIFLKAVDESDPEKLARLLPEAELAIFTRQQELYNCPQHSEELNAMCIASEALRVIKHRFIKPTVIGNRARFANFVRRSRTA